MKTYPYTEANQIRGYIAQFMRVFSGFQYKKNSRGDLGKVNVVFGGMDRILGSLMNKKDHLANGRLPIFSVNMIGLDVDTSNRRDPRHRDSIKNRVTGERVAERLIGPAFNLNMELAIYASSTTELFQLLEQILLVFNPRVTINVDSFAENGDYITDIELTSLQDELQKPLGTEAKVVMYSLGFSVPVRLRYPVGHNDNIINVIKTNIESGDGLGFEYQIGESD